MQNEICFQPIRRQPCGAVDQFFLFLLQHLISNTALAISLHQFGQRTARFILEERGRQFELNLLVQIFNDL